MRTAETSTVALLQEKERETGNTGKEREGQTSRRHGGRGPRDVDSVEHWLSPEAVPSSVALAASNYDLGPRENYRSWLLDTGCKYDLTTRASIPTHQIDLISRAPVPIILATANDLVSGDKIAPQQIGELGEVAEPYVLDSTPDVLSIGRRCDAA